MLDRIRRLADAATEGPWGVEEDEFGIHVESKSQGYDVLDVEDGGLSDAALAAHSRQLVPLMLEELEARRLCATRGNTLSVLPGDEHSAGARVCLAQEALDSYITKHL